MLTSSSVLLVELRTRPNANSKSWEFRPAIQDSRALTSGMGSELPQIEDINNDDACEFFDLSLDPVSVVLEFWREGSEN